MNLSKMGRTWTDRFAAASNRDRRRKNSAEIDMMLP
jgi:hypothetical protein